MHEDPMTANPTVTETVASLTLEQKASLTSGESFWTTKAAPSVPSIVLTDGPHGVRLQRAGSDHLGLFDSVPATCFPPAVALGSSFDVDLLERVGAALGEESKAEGVGVLLGPGINIKRSPLCGRNFEYVSEDPLLAGVVGAALVRGVQSQGIGTSLKHFAANNQEADRMRVSADIDERTLREVYLRAFQRVVTDAQPWTVMCSYNRINGVPASQHRWLLTDVLRGEWGFEGLVVSDWGAVWDRAAALHAGLDLEMPGNGGSSDAQLVAGILDGTVDEADVDLAATRAVGLVEKVAAGARPDATYDQDAHHALAREAAAASIVLLKNDGGLLPLAAGADVAVVGDLARHPRYQGAGSSLVNPTRLDDALTAIREAAGREVPFAAGYGVDGATSPELRDEAVSVAAAAQTVLLFLGVPAAMESEGFDRDDLELPAAQLELLDAVLAVNPRTVVVLSNGGVVRLSGFDARVPAIVEGWLLGQAGGSATADVLYGAVNPSGRLAETIPARIEDTPAFLDFPGEHGHVRYAEGLFVGYRWYDARRIEVTYPFGHGLSYATFAYSDVTLDTETDGLTVRLTVTNTGDRDGADVVQVYTSVPGSAVVRAPRELRGFSKVHVPAGESRPVTVQVRREDLAHWDTRVDRWVVEGGTYVVEVGASSRDIRATVEVAVDGDAVRVPLTLDSTLGEVLAHPAAGPMVGGLMSAMADGPTGALTTDPGMLRMMASVPIAKMLTFGMPGVDRAGLEQLVAAANAAS